MAALSGSLGIPGILPFSLPSGVEYGKSSGGRKPRFYQNSGISSYQSRGEICAFITSDGQFWEDLPYLGILLTSDFVIL